jgi:hypothetical protein
MAALDFPESRITTASTTSSEQRSWTNAQVNPQKRSPEGGSRPGQFRQSRRGCSAFGGGAMGAHRKNVERIVVTTKS